MSIKCLSRVWEYSTMKGSALLLLLAIADNAADYGYAYPGIENIAHKTRLSERQVMRLVQLCEDAGELYVDRRKNKVNRYVVNVWGPEIDVPYCIRCGAIGVPPLGVSIESHHIIPKARGGSDAAENRIDLCGDCHKEIHRIYASDNMSRDAYVTLIEELRDMDVTPRVTLMSPEPSLTVKKNINRKESAASAAPYPAPPPSKPKKSAGKKRDERIDHPAYQVYQELTHRAVPFAWRDEVCKVTDFEKWRAIVKSWAGKYNPTNIEGMLDVYQNGWKNGKANGSAPPTRTIADVIHERQRSSHEPR